MCFVSSGPVICRYGVISIQIHVHMFIFTLIYLDHIDEEDYDGTCRVIFCDVNRVI